MHAPLNPAGPSADCVRFGEFELNVRTGELTCIEVVDGRDPLEKILLREQPFQILRMLIDREGRIVSKEEIRRRLWPGDTVVDFDRSINVAMANLRRALSDSAETPRYIETLARRGYRLLVPIEWQQDSGEVPFSADTAQPEDAVRALSNAGSLIGRKVSRYRVLEILGGGGMGLVYKAEDTKLGRRVALKFLPEELSEDPVALQRFEREAQTASTLNHPNICTIYGIEEYEGKPFIVMELLEGETLSGLFAQSAAQPVDLPTLLNVAMQACDGLKAAHAKGIIHRDIKPSNIFLTKDGTVKILDFGLAKLAEVEEKEENHDSSNALERSSAPEGLIGRRWDLTITGIALGTAGYMSPEQIRREKLDARTDLFSFGLVLYEMATGQRAFGGETTANVHDGILHRKLSPVRELNPSAPRRLDAVIARALEKDRAQRYQSAAEMRRELLEVRKEMRPARGRAWKWLVPAALLVALLGGLWLHFRSLVTLAPSDTVVSADFDNRTGDPVFSDGLNTALQLALQQTPYLNILSTYKVREALGLLKLPEDAKVTMEIASRVCGLTNSRAIIAGSLSDEGNRYHIELRAMDCRTGRMLTRISNDANSRDEIVPALGLSAFQLRKKLGESKKSLAEFNKPLAVATSSSPDALHFLALAYQDHLSGHIQRAIENYGKAIEEDPNMALAYAARGSAYYFSDDDAPGRNDIEKAFELRDRLTVPGRFQVETLYYGDTKSQWEKERQIAETWVQTFPHDVIARINFTVCLENLGRYDQALVQSREAARLLPSEPTYQRWLFPAISTNRLEEANEVYREAMARGFTSPRIHRLHAILAFMEGDQDAMQQEWGWALQNPSVSYGTLDLEMNIEAYYGRFRNMRRITQRNVAVALKASAVPDATRHEAHEALFHAGFYEAAEAQYNVEVGNIAESERHMAEAMRIFTGPANLLREALVSARAGKLDDAQKLIGTLNQLPHDPTVPTIPSNCLPTIRAAIRLGHNDPAAAVEILRPVEPYDLSASACFDGIYTAYIRGLAYLQMKDGRLAAEQFQKLIDYPGVVEGFITGSLARLQLARARMLMGDKDAARKSYEDFLTLWKDADPDLPIYKEAKAEYSRLRE